MPACPLHADKQTTADEHLLFALTAASRLAHAGAAADGFLRHHHGATHSVAWEQVEWSNGYPDHTGAVTSALEAIARAVYFWHTAGSRKLVGRLHVWPTFLRGDQHLSSQERMMSQHVRECLERDIKTRALGGARPDILAHQAFEEDDLIVVNMAFQGTQLVSVIGLKEPLLNDSPRSVQIPGASF